MTTDSVKSPNTKRDPRAARRRTRKTTSTVTVDGKSAEQIATELDAMAKHLSNLARILRGKA